MLFRSGPEVSFDEMTRLQGLVATEIRKDPDVAGVVSVIGVSSLNATPNAGSLKIGDTYTVGIDGYTGDLEAAAPKVDKNDGKVNDNPYFQRTNITYAHTFNNIGYWYSSSHQNPGDPDPKGAQWVDYRPPLDKLGAGRYHITAEYRQSANRASYDALYIVTHKGGVTTVKRKQTVGVEFTTFDLGDFDLGCAGYVRVQDPGAESITFDRMFFKYLGP